MIGAVIALWWSTVNQNNLIKSHPFLLYTYDTAQRLIQSEDNLCNYIVYTLDNAGNRTEEEVKTQTAVFNDLNRLIETIGAASQSTEYGYDSNGNQTSVIDPNNNTTTNTFDNLNRLIKIVAPQNGANILTTAEITLPRSRTRADWSPSTSTTALMKSPSRPAPIPESPLTLTTPPATAPVRRMPNQSRSITATMR